MKRRVLGLLVLAISLCAFGQINNARTLGLANTDITPDINRVIYVNPAFMSDYKNQLQITFNSPMIGIVKANDMISLGAILNSAPVLKGFYGTAYPLLPNIATPANAGIQYFPHILFGLDLSAVRLGFDIFWEHGRYTNEVVNAGGTTTITQSINNYGLIAGADLKLGEMGLGLNFGIGFPGIYNKIVPPAPAVVTTDVESDKGLFIKGGAELRLTLISLDWTVGLDLMREDYRFVDKTVVAPASGLTNDISVTTLTPYIGFKKEILDKVLLVAEEKSALQYIKSVTPPAVPPAAGSVENGNHQFVHTLSFGLEKMFQKVWIFDELGGRGGISWSITNTSNWNKTDAPPAPVATTDAGPVELLGPAVPYVGFGANKGVFTCDVVVNPAGWGGVLIGPPVLRVTAGLKF
jgi:hypothetical protein